ncbi:MAG: hypothetical protein NW200_02170 [Hyphomonadaceae bacterium]|nr:hypothetical protein [Hyphomonadaceae bacterium]
MGSSIAVRLARAGAGAGAAAGVFALVSPAMAGVLAVTAAAAACTHPAPHRRLAAVEDAASLAFVFAMYGPAGAGGFAAFVLLAMAPAGALLAGVRPTTALALVTAWAALAAAGAGALASRDAASEWASAWAPMLAMGPALLITAPARPLMTLASAAWGRHAAAQARWQAMGPLLVALVAGAGTLGLAGAAMGWALVRLGTPLTLLLTAPRRAALAGEALGVLAAGLVAAIAAAVGLQLAGPHPLAFPAAGGLGLLVYGLALRVHAPASARRLDALWRRLRPAGEPAPRPAPAR